MRLEFNAFFNVDEHFKKIQRKIIKCRLTQPVSLNLSEIIPDIFYQDIENEIRKVYNDIDYQCLIKAF